MNDEHGGVCGGKKIDWRVEDDQSTPEGALAATKRQAEDDKVFAFFFSMGDFGHNPAVVQYLDERRIPDMYLVTGATTPTRTRSSTGSCFARSPATTTRDS